MVLGFGVYFEFKKGVWVYYKKGCKPMIHMRFSEIGYSWVGYFTFHTIIVKKKKRHKKPFFLRFSYRRFTTIFYTLLYPIVINSSNNSKLSEKKVYLKVYPMGIIVYLGIALRNDGQQLPPVVQARNDNNGVPKMYHDVKGKQWLSKGCDGIYNQYHRVLGRGSHFSDDMFPPKFDLRDKVLHLAKQGLTPVEISECLDFYLPDLLEHMTDELRTGHGIMVAQLKISQFRSALVGNAQSQNWLGLQYLSQSNAGIVPSQADIDEKAIKTVEIHLVETKPPKESA